MNNISIKHLLAGAFFIITFMTSFIIAYVIPSQVSTELTRRIDSNLLPNMRDHLAELAKQVQTELSVRNKEDIRQELASFDREKEAIANRLVANFLPLAENFDMGGIARHAILELEGNPEIIKIAVKTEEGGNWSEYGEGSNDTKNKSYQAEKRSNFGNVVVKLYVSTSKFTRQLETENAIFSEISQNVTRASERILNETEKEVELLQAQMTESVFKKIMLLAIFSIVLLALLTTYFLHLINRIVVDPIRNAADALERVSEGDLRVKVTTLGENEVGQLLSALDRMVAKQRAQIKQISNSTTELSESSEQMSAITQQTQSGVTQQESEISLVATAVTEMMATLQEVAQNTSHAMQAANHANNESSEGLKKVGGIVTSIKLLASEVEHASNVISQLEDDANSIGSVLDVIRAIAEQTNLLALNAAIEAARAGESGRGFSVVADEVRSLANRTQQSTQEIHHIIERLQTNAHSAVEVMHSGREKANITASQATAAGGTLETMNKAVNTMLEMNIQIASASEQQVQVAEEINKNLVNISNFATQTSNGAKNAGASAKSQSELVKHLQMLMNQYQL